MFIPYQSQTCSESHFFKEKSYSLLGIFLRDILKTHFDAFFKFQKTFNLYFTLLGCWNSFLNQHIHPIFIPYQSYIYPISILYVSLIYPIFIPYPSHINSISIPYRSYIFPISIPCYDLTIVTR
jgi:hypothetical protein